MGLKTFTCSWMTKRVDLMLVQKGRSSQQALSQDSLNAIRPVAEMEAPAMHMLALARYVYDSASRTSAN
jgi:hypothetical protein